MKKIIVPIDFTEDSEKLLVVSAELARKIQAEVELFYVLEVVGGTIVHATGEAFLPDKTEQVCMLRCIEEAKNKLHKIVDNARYAGVKFIPKIKVGDPVKHFSRYITLEKADIIIMGTSVGDQIIKGIFSAYSTEKIVTRADCMVLAVKNTSRVFRVKSLVLLTNFQDDSPEFIGKLKALQEIFDFKIHLLYINPQYETSQAILKMRLRDYCNRFQIKNCTCALRQDLTDSLEIVKYAEEVDADIIALSTHQHNGLHWLGRISEELLGCTEVPLLTFKVN